MPRFESWRPSQPVLVFARLRGLVRNTREHGGMCGAQPCLRIAKSRTKARISASVSMGQFWYLVFISARGEEVPAAQGFMRLQGRLGLVRAKGSDTKKEPQSEAL